MGFSTENAEGAFSTLETIIALSKNIPNEGGLAAIFAGDNSIAKFSEQLPGLGLNLKGFSANLMGFSTENAEGAFSTLETIIALSKNVPNEGGLAALFAGDNSLASFSSQLPSLGSNLKAFSANVNGINIDNIITATDAAGLIVELSKTIPEDKLFKNETTLDEFGGQLSKYGEGLSAYYESVAGIDSNTLNSSITSTGSLVTLVNRMVNMDTSGITTFKDAIVSLSEADITGFIGSYDPISVDLSIGTINKLIDSIRNMVGLDPSGVGTFKAALDSLATVSLDDFVAAFDGSASKAATAVSNLMSSLTNAVNIGKTGFTTAFDTMIMTALSSITNKQSMFASAGQNVMHMLTSGMTSVGQSNLMSMLNSVMISLLNTITSKQTAFSVAGKGLMNAFVNGSTSGINTSPTSAFDSMILSTIASINGKATLFTTAGRNLVITFVNGISSTGNTSVLSAFNNILSSAFSFVTTRQSLFMTVGQNLVNAFANGIMSRQNAVKNVVARIVANSYDTLSRKYSDFKSAGSYLVDGFVAGIDENTWKAEAEAAAMAAAALEAAKEALGIQSPSKEFYEVGDFAGQGLVNAMYDYSGKVSKAGRSMADYAVKGLTNAISKVKDVLDSNMDSNPTIRPVLDLSNVQNGVGTLSGMMNRMSGFTLSGSVAMAQQTVASMNSRTSANRAFEEQINDSITSLSESIKELRADMAKQYEASQATPEVNLYMDSRKVASSIAKPMDKELNMLAKRRK